MANNIIKRTWKQGGLVNIEDLRGSAFQAESGGHTFLISGVDENGDALALSGTPAGVLLRADGQDVTLTCSVSDGVVSATLPANAYVVPGRVGITIFLTSDGQKTAIYAAVGSVATTSSGTVAPPAGSDVVDLVNAIATAVATIPASYTDLMAAVAPTYSTSALYAVGSYAWYSGKLYRCTTAITSGETWTSAHWTQANLGSDVSDLKSAISGDMPTLLKANVYIKKNDGSESAYNGWSATDFVEIGLIDYLYVNISVATEYNAFYDSSKEFIEGAWFPLLAGDNVIAIPSGAKYFRISNTTASMNAMTIKSIVGELDYDSKYLKEIADSLVKKATVTAESSGNKYFTFSIKSGKKYRITNNSNNKVSARTETFNGTQIQSIGTFSSGESKDITASANADRLLFFFIGTGNVTIELLDAFIYQTNEELGRKANAVIDVVGDSPTFTKIGDSTTINSTDGKNVNITFAVYGNALGFNSNGIDTSVGKRYAIWAKTDSSEALKISVLKTGGSWDTLIPMDYIPSFGHYGVMDIANTNDGYLYIIYAGDTIPKTMDISVYAFDVTNNTNLEAFIQQEGGFNLAGSNANSFLRFGKTFGKKIEYFGDSNTANDKYRTFANRRNGVLASYKAGVGGSNVAGNGSDAFWKDARINTLHDDSDIIYIMGGTNDSANGRTIGTASLDNHDTSTFIGAYNVIISKIYYKYIKDITGYYASAGVDYTGVNRATDKKQILIVLGTPPFTSDPTYVNNGKMSEIVEAVKTVGNMWGLPVVDVWGNSELNAINYSSYYSDTVHVNVFGGQKIGNIIGKRINDVLS